MPRKIRYWQDPERWRAETAAWCRAQPPEYRVWAGMVSRCHDKGNKDYPRYGGRGVVVCWQWRESFEVFLRDMGSRPTRRHTLERLENEGNYCKTNCAWRTRKSQSRNTSTNRILRLRGRSQCVSAWADELAINRSTIYTRLSRGWSVGRALS